MKLSNIETLNKTEVLRIILKYAWEHVKKWGYNLSSALKRAWMEYKNHAGLVYILTGVKLPYAVKA